MLKGQRSVEGGIWGRRTSSTVAPPEALHMKIIASCQLVFCAVLIFLPFLKKTKQNREKVKKPNDFVAALKREGGKVNLQQKAFVLSDSHVLGGGRPPGTHYTPLASAKAVTLTNSQRHNAHAHIHTTHSGSVCVFTQSPLCWWHKSSWARPVKCASAANVHKASFLVFLKKKKSLILLLHFFNPPPHHTDTFWVFWQRGVAGQYMMKTVNKS